MPHRMIVLAGTVLLAAGLQAGALASDITLVRDGKPASVILIAENPTPAAQLAAMELQHHVEQITGARLPVRHPRDATRVCGFWWAKARRREISACGERTSSHRSTSSELRMTRSS